MPTMYQCKGCKLVFEGNAPVYLDGALDVILPKCPSAQVDIQKEFDNPDVTFADYGNFLKYRERVDQILVAHVVVMRVDEPAKPALPKLQGAWGAKPLALKAETAEEARAREEQSKQDAILRKEQERQAKLAQEAQKLVNRMESEFATLCGNKSANFPKDLEYGTKASGKPVTASAEVILRASLLWASKGPDYSYRAPKFKKVWGVKMANFEKLIVSGNASEGKHNYHITLN